MQNDRLYAPEQTDRPHGMSAHEPELIDPLPPRRGLSLAWLPAPLRGVVATLLLLLNTAWWCGLLFLLALPRLLLRSARVRRRLDPVLNGLATRWIAGNSAWMRLTQPTRWDVSMPRALDTRHWYVVTCNHQSWVDIFVLQHVLNRRIPMLKFFTKKELIYVPVIGFAWWALDFPFMQRKGGASARADLEAGRKACEKFRLVPTSVMSFVEGTRFTPAKHAQQKSPYRHLLKPKVGSIGMALEALGDAFTGFLDVTIVYPDGTPTFTDALAGRLGNVVVRVHLRSIPAEVLPPPGEPAPRAAVQAWVNELWQAKDEEIEQVLAERKGKPN